MIEHKVNLELSAVTGIAELTLNNSELIARFNGTENSYIISYKLPEVLQAQGIVARLKLHNWQHINYVALGYMADGKFRHIKAKNISQKAPVDFRVHHHDIIWQLENPELPLDTADIDNVRLFIKGTPNSEGATVNISSISLLLEDTHEKPDNCATQQAAPAVMALISDYLKHSFRNFVTQSEHYLATGDCPMPGDKTVAWPISSRQPGAVQEVTTFRFGWHGLHPAINLMLYAQQQNHLGALMAARSFIEQWLNDSFYRIDSDKKYAWYDHGTAERLLAFLLMWQLSAEHNSDQRFMRRLVDAITQHAELLASEAFYAYNQPARYHNHAWFQDAALIAAALCLPQYPRADIWLTTAITRFEDQLDTLIVRDGGFAIFVENSIGYHHGVQHLSAFAGELVALSGRATEIPQIAQELIAWSDFLRYPDGRAPAQGDTFRLAPRTSSDIRRGTAWHTPGCTVLPKAGYAVIKGNHDAKPWMLCLFNTSLSSTHKHEDNLHITLWFDGVEWLIDPSFYSHEYSNALPTFLRSANAHNAVFLANKNYDNVLSTTNIKLLEQPAIGLVAEHRSYSNVTVKRALTVTAPNVITVSDSLVGIDTNINNAELNFITAENVSIERAESGVKLTSSDSSYELNLAFLNSNVQLSIANCHIGLGFMQDAQVHSVNVELPATNSIDWQITFAKKASKQTQTINIHATTILPNALTGKLNVALIGSCVTRDALKFIECSNINYFARTSFISLVAPPLSINEDSLDIKGNFEKRMVVADFKKTAIQSISENPPDIILLDFIDERFDICQVGASYVTRSNYMLQAFSNNENFNTILKKKNIKSLWLESCNKVMAELSALNVPIVMHKAWWASSYMNHDTKEIVSFSDDELRVVKENNDMLKFYYDAVRAACPNIIELELDKELVYSDFAHQWGRDYFHYSNDYYKSFSSKLNNLIAGFNGVVK